jgi:ribosome-binding protein aMBF1 (putative translation factor)
MSPQDMATERVNRGFSIRSLAVKLDVPEGSIRRLENGLRTHPATAKKVADFYGCKVTDLAAFKDAA